MTTRVQCACHTGVNHQPCKCKPLCDGSLSFLYLIQFTDFAGQKANRENVTRKKTGIQCLAISNKRAIKDLVFFPTQSFLIICIDLKFKE